MCRTNERFDSTGADIRRRLATAASAAIAALLLGACANTPKIGDTLTVADAGRGKAGDAAKPAQTELEKAIEYWGKENAKNPRDLKSSINYALNLKAAGQKEQALTVLQTASIFHGNSRELASEYGRLALEMGQTSLAQKLLESADDPGKPDWKIISARGTAFAKQGLFSQAIPLYERALALSPGQPSVTSNLAMAHAANGEAPRAEAMLRKIAETPDADPRVRQNLALVLGLQGKYDEARAVSARDIPQDTASANVEYVRQMVRVEPQQAPKSAPALGPGVWVTNLATGSLARPATAGATFKPSQP
jgi:Flp pilus assembly protein TadD